MNLKQLKQTHVELIISPMQPSRVITILVQVIIGVVEFFLGLRFLFKLLGASSKSEFVQWIYETSQPMLDPFIDIFPSPNVSGRFIFELNTLLAILIYALIGYLFTEVIKMISRSNH